MGAYTSKSFFSQSFNIPTPNLTEKNLPDQSGKVALITGGYAGVGQELSRILYQNNATVYIAGRSAEKAAKSISATKQLFPSSKGRIEFLFLDLADLSTIKKSAQEFMSKESRLDVLVNNAGVMFPPAGSKSAQGHEIQMGTNVLGHFLFSELLVPVLKKTVISSPANSIRVTWAGSLGIQVYAPEHGVQFDEDNNPILFKSQQTNYGQSKTANLYLATEFGRRHAQDGIVSVCFNPGNLSTELQRHSTGLEMAIAKRLLYPAVFGAYTELWAGWGEEVGKEGKEEGRGIYVVPWGRNGWSGLRRDVLRALEEGGVVEKLWGWCEKSSVEFR